MSDSTEQYVAIVSIDGDLANSAMTKIFPSRLIATAEGEKMAKSLERDMANRGIDDVEFTVDVAPVGYPDEDTLEAWVEDQKTFNRLDQGDLGKAKG